MNLSHPKNLETLRSECEKLGARVARLAFIRAVLFVLFVFTLASAFQIISSNDASGIVNRIRKLQEITQKNVDLDDFLTAIYFPTGIQTGGSETNLPAAEPASAEASVPASAEVENAKKEQAALEGQLTKIASEAFTFAFKAPLLGTEIKLDLRVWGFILVLCFIFWEVYLFIQRHKLRTLQRIAGLVAARAPEDATLLDHLLFRWDGRRRAAFGRHPGQFEFVASLIGAVALVVYLCWEGYDFWKGTDPKSKLHLVELYAFVITYTIAYGAYVKRQINAEAAKIEGFEPVVSYSAPILARVFSWLSAFGGRVWPEVNLVTGSAMVIGTLWLLVAAPLGCQERTGWTYLHKPDGWLVGPVSGFGALDKSHNLLIAALYGIGLADAGFAFVVLLFSLVRRRRLGVEGISLWLATVTTALALFFLSELAFGHLLDIPPYSYLCLLLWLVPTWIWWRYAHSKRDALRADWPRVRKSLFYWYAPQVVVATIVSVGTLFESHPLVGVPVFVGGLAVLALGYWNARASTAATGR